MKKSKRNLLRWGHISGAKKNRAVGVEPYPGTCNENIAPEYLIVFFFHQGEGGRRLDEGRFYMGHPPHPNPLPHGEGIHEVTNE